MPDAPAPLPADLPLVILQLSATELRPVLGELADLLVDAVDSGASIGFLARPSREDAVRWWTSAIPGVEDGRTLLWIAKIGDRVIGTVQVQLTRTPNGRHRAEVAKLMVHRDARGRGAGRELLEVAEEAAAEAGVTLLLLDTQTGSAAERLYGKAGWTPLGVVPDYAADPSGELKPTTFFYKTLV